MSLYRVTQTGNGLLIEEYENGRWEIESPDADETYELEGNRLIKTEVDDDGIDIDIYYDLNGDGIFVESDDDYDDSYNSISEGYTDSEDLYDELEDTIEDLYERFEDLSDHIFGGIYRLAGIKDFDGILHGGLARASEVSASYLFQGLIDIDGDGQTEGIYTNQSSGRWATVSYSDPITKTVDYSNYGEGGRTRIVGTYEDPLIATREVERNGPFDSQRRFSQDLLNNALEVRDSGDYDGDGAQEIYWKVINATGIYLRAIMHADGNIQYANYQNSDQLNDYLTSTGNENAINAII